MIDLKWYGLTGLGLKIAWQLFIIILTVPLIFYYYTEILGHLVPKTV
jgi:hypothetical protein